MDDQTVNPNPVPQDPVGVPADAPAPVVPPAPAVDLPVVDPAAPAPMDDPMSAPAADPMAAPADMSMPPSDGNGTADAPVDPAAPAV